MQAIEGAFNRLTYELIINGVEDEDYGDYTCQIRNSEGTTTRTIKLESKFLFIYCGYFPNKIKGTQIKHIY